MSKIENQKSFTENLWSNLFFEKVLEAGSRTARSVEETWRSWWGRDLFLIISYCLNMFAPVLYIIFCSLIVDDFRTNIGILSFKLQSEEIDIQNMSFLKQIVPKVTF